MLRQYIEMVKGRYDYLIIDIAPSFDLLTVNALAATDLVIITEALYFIKKKDFKKVLLVT